MRAINPFKIVAGLTLVAFIALIAVFLDVFQEAPETLQVQLPRDDDIVTLKATLFKSPWTSGPVAEFAIPPRYIPKIMAAFRTAEPEEYKILEGDPLGRLLLTTKGGGTVEIELFFYGKAPTHFSVNGVLCVRRGDFKPAIIVGENDEVFIPEGSALAEVIGEIHAECKFGTANERLKQCLDYLEMSRGERLPERPVQ
jgi:hypothetical protein